MVQDDLPPASVSQRLKFVRNALGISQAKMAHELGTAQSTVADYELGKYDVPHPVCLAIEHCYGVNHLWLKTGEGEAFLKGGGAAGPTAHLRAAEGAGRPVIITDRSELERLDELEGRDRFHAVPYLRDAAAAGKGLLVEDAVEGYCLIHERVAPRPENLRCLRVSGDSMSPLLPDGSIVAVDITLNNLRVVDGKIVCARTEDDEIIIKRLRVQGRYALLFSESENQDRYPPLVLDLNRDKEVIVGQVVWAWVDLR